MGMTSKIIFLILTGVCRLGPSQRFCPQKIRIYAIWGYPKVFIYIYKNYKENWCHKTARVPCPWPPHKPSPPPQPTPTLTSTYWNSGCCRFCATVHNLSGRHGEPFKNFRIFAFFFVKTWLRSVWEWLRSAPMPAHESNSQRLCSQWKPLGWVSATQEHAPDVSRVSDAELNPMLLFFFHPRIFFPLTKKYVSLPLKFAFLQTIPMPGETSAVNNYTHIIPGREYQGQWTVDILTLLMTYLSVSHHYRGKTHIRELLTH